MDWIYQIFGPGLTQIFSAIRIGVSSLSSLSEQHAVAFCRWLNARFSHEITLPTEQQWERAARGTNGLVYPYSNTFDSSKSNTHETRIGQTNVVGIFPNGASPDCVLEMSGNIYSWCLNKYEHEDVTEIDDSGDQRVLRGGSFVNLGSYARNTSRLGSLPGVGRMSSFGFRVVRPPQTDT